MEFIFRLLYRIFIYPLILFGARVGSIFHPKLKRGLAIHKGAMERWKEKSQSLEKSKPTVWFHATSVGEFEQARPVIDRLRNTKGNKINIVVSYYSPTVENDVKKYPSANFSEILPLDRVRRVRRVLKWVNPIAIVFVKFDTWPNIVWEAAKTGAKLFLIDGTLRERSFRFSSFLGRSFFRTMYSKFEYIGTVSQADTKRFAVLSSDKVHIKTVGDTRFDRVKSRQAKAEDLKIPSCFINLTRPVFIAGSTWPGDEERLIPAIKTLRDNGHKFHSVIVPHEPSSGRIAFIEKQLASAQLEWLRYSAVTDDHKLKDVTILDGIGFLAEFYQIGTFCYVGGAFLASGVHNCMEPAVMGMPLMFGPNHQNAPEAEEMVRRELGYQVLVSNDIVRVAKNWLQHPQECSRKGSLARSYIEESIGSAHKYCDEISERLRI